MVGSVPVRPDGPLVHLWCRRESCKSVRLCGTVIVGYRHVGVKLFCKFQFRLQYVFYLFFNLILKDFFCMIEPKCMFHFRARMYICKFCTSFDVLMLIVFFCFLLFLERFVSKQLHADNCSYLYKTFHVYSIPPPPFVQRVND